MRALDPLAAFFFEKSSFFSFIDAADGAPQFGWCRDDNNRQVVEAADELLRPLSALLQG
jgi:hypothetical protein